LPGRKGGNCPGVCLFGGWVGWVLLGGRPNQTTKKVANSLAGEKLKKRCDGKSWDERPRKWYLWC